MLDETRLNDGQKKVLRTEGNVLVSASAGSGKTTVMIEKILRILDNGGSLKRMAVMTFSRAAAAEMKNRLIKGLYELLRRPNAAVKHVLEQLEAFPFANICTIDSFCYSLVQKYFACIGADPSLTVLDPEDSDRLLDESLDEVIASMLEQGRVDFIKLAEKYARSRKLDKLKEEVLRLRNFLKVQEDPEAFLRKSKEGTECLNSCAEYAVSHYKKILKELLLSVPSCLAALKSEQREEETEILMKASDAFLRLLRTEDAVPFFSCVRNLVAPKKTQKRKGISEETKFLYNSLCSAFGDFVGEVAPLADKYFLRPYGGDGEGKILCELYERTEEIYGEKKRLKGKLDFQDMGLMALEILKDDGIRREVEHAYDHVFVDEYQDTNYLQEKLLGSVAGDKKLFVVGDVKQAIYHFRYAEPEIFNARRIRYDGGSRMGENIFLNENYRSDGRILEFVNRVCSEVLTEEFSGLDYRQTGVMQAGTEYPTNSPAVDVVIFEKEEEKLVASGVYSVKKDQTTSSDEAESLFVAMRIAQICGKETVYRPKMKQPEVLRYGSVAVLTRTKKQAALVGKALDKFKIPYFVRETADGVFPPRELLVDFLRLCRGEDDVSVVNVMMSSVFQFGADDLIEIRSKNKKTSVWEALKLYSGDQRILFKIEKLFAYFESLMEKSAYMKVSDLFFCILSDGLDGYFASLGKETSARVYRFIQSVRQLECDTSADAFLSFYDRSYKGERPVAADNAITVMTVHQSKGLEFPVVFLPFADEPSVGVNLAQKSVFSDRMLGLATKAIDADAGVSSDTFATSVHKLKIKNEEREELARLLYVGLTRAENRLIVSGKESAVPDSVFRCKSFLDFIRYAAVKNPVLSLYFRKAETTVNAVADEKRTELQRTLDFSVLESPYGNPTGTVLPSKLSVSEIAQRENEGEVTVFTPETQRSPSEQNGREKGIAYHAVLQHIPWGILDERETETALIALVKQGKISAEQATLADPKKILRILNMPMMRKAANSLTRREQPFVLARRVGEDTSLVQGVIDLVIEDDDGLIVVDYKSSGLSPEALRDKYAAQVSIYAEAAERIWKQPIKKCVLLNILREYEVAL